MRYFASGFFQLLGAGACCYLGLLLARVLWEAPRLLMALTPGSEFHGIQLWGLNPRFYVFGPAGRGALGAAALAALSMAIVLLALRFAPGFSRRFTGWGRLLVSFTVFWLALFVVDAAVYFALYARGPLRSLFQVVAAPGWGAPAPGILFLLVLVPLTFVLLSRAAGDLPPTTQPTMWKRGLAVLLWIVLPVVAINLLQRGAPLAFEMSRAGWPFAPSLLALTVVVPVLWKARQATGVFQPGWKGGTGVLLSGVVAYAGLTYYPDIVRHRRAEALEARQSRHWDLRFEPGQFTEEQQREWAAAADERVEALAGRLGISLTQKPRTAYVHVTSESKQSLAPERRNDSPYVIEGTDTLHHFLAPDRTISDPRGEAVLLMASEWGEPASAAVGRAMARYAAGDFLGRNLTGYARQIACEERPYTLREILAVDGDYRSSLMRDATSGAWVESLMRAQGTAVLHKLYRAPLGIASLDAFAEALAPSWETLEDDWRTWLTPANGCEEASRVATRRGAHQDHRGVSFTHEFPTSWGYGTDTAQDQLKKIRSLGGNTVALIPYASTSAPRTTTIRFRLSETHERLVRSVQQARAAGLQIMLKPQLWGGTFTGDIRFERREEFDEWFAQYRRWILHYARLAELYEVELFSIGNELNGVSVHEDAWRELIRAVRRVYRGPITFAANWNEEFERIAFWDKLDYAGVNFYFPLAENGALPEPHSPRLQELVGRMAAVAERFGKPVLFTEIGYPSLTIAAAEPWREPSAAPDPELQSECYRAVFEVFSGQPWFAGFYWWKWPSHGRGGALDTTHNPIGKPALAVLREWYHKPQWRPEQTD